MSSHGKSSLANGHELNVGEHLVSPNKQVYLTLQSDGHLAVFRKDKSDKPVWESTINPETPNVEGPFTLKMQEDNNVVVYDGKEQAIWHTATYSPEFAGLFHLDMDNDGNFHVRDQKNKVIWTSHTAVRRFSEGKEGVSILDNGQELHTGQYLVSPNEQVYLTMRSDGHVAIYKKDKPDLLLWKSTINPDVSNVEGPFTLVNQWDKNVVVYDAQGQPIWHTSTWNYLYQARLSLDNNDGLILHRKDNPSLRIWSSADGKLSNYDYHYSGRDYSYYDDH